MSRNKFLPFLILSLTLTAFLVGYIMIGRGLGSGPQSKTGTILDKFGEPTDSTPPESSPATEQPEEAKIFPVSSVKVVSISNSADRKGVTYFEKNTGKLFEFNFEDNEEKITSDAVLPNFLSSIWSPVKKEVLSLFYSLNGTKIKYHSYDTGKTIDLDTDIHSVAFSPDGGLIAYYIAGSTNSDDPAQIGEVDPINLPMQTSKIYIAQTDGTYPKKILDTRISDLEIYWPIKNKIAFSTPTSEIFLLTEEGGLTKFLESKSGLNTKWSNTGTKLLFSYLRDPASPASSLHVKDVEFKSEQNLNISALASKCAWSIDDVTIFCAVAKTPSIDEIYQINTLDGSQKLVAEPNMPIKEVFLPALEDHLVFTSAGDEKLYGIKISP